MGAGPPAPDPPKPAAPGLTCPGLCQATLLTGNAGALRGQRPRRLLLREQTCVMRELTVYRAAHTQPPRLPRCLAKPAHPACWDKFPGRRHSPQVRRGELEEQPLLCSPRKQQHGEQASSVAPCTSRRLVQVRLGSPGRPSSLAAAARPPLPSLPSTWGGGAWFRGEVASTGFCLTDAR